MKDFLTDILFEISDESEKKASKLAIKVLYYLSCIVISIWLADNLGYSFKDVEVSYRIIVNFFAELYIVVAVLVVIFIVAATRVVARASKVLMSLLIHLIAYYTYFNGKSVIIHLLNKKVIDKDLKKGENFETYVKNMKYRKKLIDENILQFDYYAALLVSLWFTYVYIIPERFPNLYFPWINVVLTTWASINFLLLGFLDFLDSKIKEIRKKLRIVDLATDDSNSEALLKAE